MCGRWPPRESTYGELNTWPLEKVRLATLKQHRCWQQRMQRQQQQWGARLWLAARAQDQQHVKGIISLKFSVKVHSL